MPTLKVVNITPVALSGDRTQDGEPSLAVNPERPTDMIATAFTPDPMGGPLAPVYVSTNGGDTWVLRSIVPGGAQGLGTGDISVSFASMGGTLYAGILNGQAAVEDILRMQVLRSPGISSTTPMQVLVSRDEEDQPWVVAGSVSVDGAARDRVYVAHNDFGQGTGRTATVDVSGNARTSPPPAGFQRHAIEQRATTGQDGPPVRVALHPDGTVYAVFQSWQNRSGSNVFFDVVVTRDDNGAVGSSPFEGLEDAQDSTPGQRVATQRFVKFGATMGQERLGGDLSIAVDPTDPGSVWVAWCDRVGGLTGTDYTLHVRHSTDHGQTWSTDLRTITDAKNPALAVNTDSLLGLASQRFTQGQWVTVLEMTDDDWQTPPERHELHQAPANVPARRGLPYLGDYMRLLTVDRDFYGVFSGNNTPDPANFPEGVTYQRHADFVSHQLLDLDNVTRVPASIDPFFYHRAA
ncbi:sialidase family protein [Streptomyces sp. LARHCF249]